MAFDEDAVMRRYATLVNESVHERDVLTNRCNPMWAHPTATRKLAYRTEKERTLLLHALSQIPLELAEATPKNNLGQPQLSSDRETLMFRFYASMGFDPLMHPYALGDYELVYSSKSTLWRMSVLWSEGVGEHIYSFATGFDTLSECLDYVRDARSLGIVHWKAERDNIAARVASTKGITT